MDAEQLSESVRFLLTSIRQISDRMVDSNEGITRSFERVCADISALAERVENLERDYLVLRDKELISCDSSLRKSELPIRPDQQGMIIPALNLPVDGLLDVYRNTPSLLQPFSRSCSVSARTLSGSIPELELEVFAQGTSWIIELNDGEWVLLPRPGILKRQRQVESLGRLFKIEVESPLPAEIELLKPGVATVVEHGRRWYLKEKGSIGAISDPTQRSMESRISYLEKQLSQLGQ